MAGFCQQQGAGDIAEDERRHYRDWQKYTGRKL